MDGHANFLRCNLHICTSIVVYPAWKQGWNRAAGRNPMDEAVPSMIGWPYMLRVVPLSLSLSWMTWKKPAPVTWRKQRGKMAPRDSGGEKAVSFDRLSERGTNRGLNVPKHDIFSRFVHMQPKKKSQTLSTYNYPSNTSKWLSALLSNIVKPKGQIIEKPPKLLTNV